jgi:predicted transcriptional regulator
MGKRQKAILKMLKSTPMNVWRLKKATGYRVSWLERSLWGLNDKGLVERRPDRQYGDTWRVTQKGKAIAQRKGVLV